ncbi:MAG: response regulator, partial [Candidatus Angelobacter sp.]
MPAEKWNGQKTVGSGKATKLVAPAGTRIQKIMETGQTSSDYEKKPRHKVTHAHGSQNVVLQSRSQKGTDAVQQSAESEKTDKKLLTVLIADDHPVVREGLATIIQLQPDMRVIAEASNGRDAMEKYFACRPDIALLDLRMPLMDGVATVIAICEKEPGARLAILTSFESEEEIYRALRAGAQGYVLKDA